MFTLYVNHQSGVRKLSEVLQDHTGWHQSVCKQVIADKRVRVNGGEKPAREGWLCLANGSWTIAVLPPDEDIRAVSFD